MTWQSIVKGSRKSDGERKVWTSMKPLIDEYVKSEGDKEFSPSDLRIFLIENLPQRVKDEQITPDLTKPEVGGILTAIRQALNDLSVENVQTTKYFGQKIPRYLSYNYGIKASKSRNKYIKKSWDYELKAGQSRSASRKLVEGTIKEMLTEFLKDKDEVNISQVKEFIIENLKQEHIKRHSVDGKVTSAISGAASRYIKNKLDTHLKNKIPIMIKKIGYDNKYAHSIAGGQAYYTKIKKADSWESMVDSMIAEGKLFEEIYTAILRKYKFSAPSKNEVISYLNANYKKHSLFSNKWNTKGEGKL